MYDGGIKIRHGRKWSTSSQHSKQLFSSNKEMWRTVLIVLLVLCVLGLVIAVIILAIPNDVPSENLCLGESCLKAAINILDNMDKNVEPCDNFWQYSCGNYIKNHPVFPFRDSSYGILITMMAKVETRLLSLITEAETKDTISPVKKVKELFYTCIDDVTKIDIKRRNATLELADTFGGVPFINGYMNSNFSHLEFLVYYTEFTSLNAFFVFRATQNYKPYLEIIPTPLPAKKVIFNVIEQVTEFMGFPTKYNMTEIGYFMDAYNKMKEESTGTDNFRMNISEISNSFTYFDMERYINNILSIADVKLSNDSLIKIVNMEQVENITRLINETSLDTLVDILFANLIYQVAQQLLPNEKITTVHNENLELARTPSRNCLSLCKGLAKNVLEKLYVGKYFSDEIKNKAKEMSEYITKAAITLFTENTWLDKQSKEAVLKKMKSLLNRITIGYRPAYISDEFLNKLYENVTVRHNTYFNVFEFSRPMLMWEFKSIAGGVPVDKDLAPSYDVNAMYNFKANKIGISAGIFQPPFFDVNVPAYINFGGVGQIIGHEIMHAFDNNGINYDEFGVLQQLLTSSSREKFDERKTGLEEDLSNFKIKSINETFNSSTKMGEAIADLSGLKITYMGYKLWNQNHVEPTLPDISMSSDQLFFIAHSQMWCSNKKLDKIKQNLISDPHAPSEARSMVTVRNFGDFSKAFYCRRNLPMNPPKKNEIW